MKCAQQWKYYCAFSCTCSVQPASPTDWRGLFPLPGGSSLKFTQGSRPTDPRVWPRQLSSMETALWKDKHPDTHTRMLLHRGAHWHAALIKEGEELDGPRCTAATKHVVMMLCILSAKILAVNCPHVLIDCFDFFFQKMLPLRTDRVIKLICKIKFFLKLIFSIIFFYYYYFYYFCMQDYFILNIFCMIKLKQLTFSSRADSITRFKGSGLSRVADSLFQMDKSTIILGSSTFTHRV